MHNPTVRKAEIQNKTRQCLADILPMREYPTYEQNHHTFTVRMH